MSAGGSLPAKLKDSTPARSEQSTGNIHEQFSVPPATHSTSAVSEPAGTVYSFNGIEELHDALDWTYRLGVSLPDAPLEKFLAKTKSIPRSTEAERLVVQRVGQDIFRKALMEYWKGRCPLTGITDPALLRASHIGPWAECETDALRLDVHNGLLLISNKFPEAIRNGE